MFTGIRPTTYENATNSVTNNITVNRTVATQAQVEANRSRVVVDVNSTLANGTIRIQTSFPNNTSNGPNTVLTTDIVPSSTGTSNLTGNFSNLTNALGRLSFQTENYTNGTNRTCLFSNGTGVVPQFTFCNTTYDNRTIQTTNISGTYNSFFQNNQTTQSIFNLTTFLNGTIENITNGTFSDINTTNYTANGGAASSVLTTRFKTNGTNFTERINLDGFVGFNRSFFYPNASNFTVLTNLGSNTSIVTYFNFSNGTNITNVSAAPTSVSNGFANAFVVFFNSPNVSGNYNYTFINYTSNSSLENKTIYNNGTTNFSLVTPLATTAIRSNQTILQVPKLGQTNPDNYTNTSNCIQSSLYISQQPNLRVEILNNTRSPGANLIRTISFNAVDNAGTITQGSATVKVRYFNGTTAEWTTTISNGVNSTTGFFLKPNTTVPGGTPIRENFGPSPTDPVSDSPTGDEPATYAQLCP